MQKRILTSGKVTICYSIKRKQSKKHFLVFVHGIGGDYGLWNPERKYLESKGYSTLAVDLRGHGYSGRPAAPEDYAPEKSARDINEVLKKERISNFVLIGHCFGGMVCMAFHKLYPEKAKAYILIDTGYVGFRFHKQFSESAAFKKLNQKLVAAVGHSASYRKHNNFQKEYAGTGDWNVRRIYCDMRRCGYESWIWTLNSLGCFNGEKALKCMTQPVLIIQGTTDTIFNMGMAMKMNSMIANSRVATIPGANHQVTLNNTRELQENIYEFCEKEFP